ncbi:MAG TPA: response regulator [Candidatus Saccharimonadales bacterium]|nr:response regulator [Candidatus Saccharimonadales bacterium]
MAILEDIKILTGKKPVIEQPVETPEPAKKVLIVEDEEALANALEDKFKAEGFQIEKAENGELGLEKAKAFKPDVILLDLLMPIMDGKTMLFKLRAIDEFKHLPVVVLTNNGEIENIRDTQFYNNAVEFLIKSNVSLEDIVKRVKYNTY